MIRRLITILIGAFLPVFCSQAQNLFSVEAYESFRTSVSDLSYTQLQEKYSLANSPYYKGFEIFSGTEPTGYLDSVILKLNLTEGELHLLEQNRFFVTERLSYNSFGHAFHTVYAHDLPVFISTDAILHALHRSYDEILKTMEQEVMRVNLEIFLGNLYASFSKLEERYSHEDELFQPLQDAGLYISMAYSLMKGELQPGLAGCGNLLQEVWEAVQSEKMTEMALFAQHTRKLDFSQFTVRGHYVHTQDDIWRGYPSLEPYFRAMMWLGRIDFFLTPPPLNPWEEPWSEEDILRMNLTAFMINELFMESAELDKFLQNEQIIDYLVGESDNIQPSAYQEVLNSLSIHSAIQLLDESTYASYRSALSGNPAYKQKILSTFFFMDPYADTPDELPISYRLSGQRFIIDSYILGNVVYDRIIYKGEKVWRPMPHPFDALFALGNNDVLPLLEEEFQACPYAGQLANLRYLVDSKEDAFWEGSLYNVWLQSIRELNPSRYVDGMPLFMKSAAWHQEKMNTQLAGWSQLRHDNLLYAKQSYTGGTACSFPYSYVEPFPDFYGSIQKFALQAKDFFGQLPLYDTRLSGVVSFFERFAEVTGKLEVLARKEISGEPFSNEEAKWLQTMLFPDGESGKPPFTGWYSDLFFNTWHASENDYTVVDIHTQPTDQPGNVVGKVLHAGTGRVNLGVFIAENPENQKPMAYVGPVLSYYQDITNNFKRLTDQEWTDRVWQKKLPERPEWTNIYLAGETGEIKKAGPELSSVVYTATGDDPVNPGGSVELSVFPNPFTQKLTLRIRLTNDHEITFRLLDATGAVIHAIPRRKYLPGLNQVAMNGANLAPGIYFITAEMETGHRMALKIIKK
jgi:hypothetical protein